MMENMNGLSIDLLSHPGETLEEVLESNNMTQKELAARIDISQKHLNQIIKGVVGISHDVAFKLGNVFSLPASFWNKLQADYDLQKMYIEEKDTITEEEKNIFPNDVYKQLCDFRYLDKQKDKTSKILQFRHFIGMSSLLNQESLLRSTACFRKSEKVSTNLLALTAWMKICEIETDKIELNTSFNKECLYNKINQIKSLNVSYDINFIVKELKKIFAECGIAFDVVKSLKGAPVQGMVRRINNKVRMCVTLRNANADIVWFSLCHEIGHLLHNDDEYYIQYANGDSKCVEDKADIFARNMLLPDDVYKRFVEMGKFNRNSIIDYAYSNNVLPCILLGRLQHDGFIEQNRFNDLKLKYKWATA